MYVLATLPGSVHSIISQEHLLLESIGWMVVENPIGVFTKCAAFGTLAKCKGYREIMNVNNMDSIEVLSMLKSLHDLTML